MQKGKTQLISSTVTRLFKKFVASKGEGTVDQSTVIRWLKKFRSDCKNLDDQERSGRPEIAASEAVFIAIGTNPTLGGYQANLVSYRPVWLVIFTTLTKTSLAAERCLTLPSNLTLAN